MEINRRKNMAGLTNPNFVLSFDDMGYDNPRSVQFVFTVKKTKLARLKYWLFCKFFPFKIKRWD